MKGDVFAEGSRSEPLRVFHAFLLHSLLGRQTLLQALYLRVNRFGFLDDTMYVDGLCLIPSPVLKTSLFRVHFPLGLGFRAGRDVLVGAVTLRFSPSDEFFGLHL